jgi:ketosteroid isomerase-like protein
MLYRRTLLILVLAAWFCVPLTAHGDEVDDLRASVNKAIAAINARDLDAYAATWHDQVVVFSADSPLPIAGKPSYQQAMQDLFTNSESITLAPVGLELIVLGDTGIMQGFYSLTVKPKDGPARTEFGRVTGTHVKSDGNWLLAVLHTSVFPSGH